MDKSALKHPKFFNRYVEKVPHGDLIHLLEASYSKLQTDLKTLSNADFNYAYQPEKWTIGKLIRHCIDTEQIFGYRALCIARQDPHPIMSFDENKYADASGNDFDKNDLLLAFELIRKQNVLLFKSFDTSWLQRNSKTSSGDDLSLVSIAYIIIGHWEHHKSILQSRYGIDF
ncbi:MAG: hypothetical protein RL642_1538 [Bacteroidota bacterium]